MTKRPFERKSQLPFDDADLDDKRLVEAFNRLPDVPMDADVKDRVREALSAAERRQGAKVPAAKERRKNGRRSFGGVMAALAAVAVVAPAVIGINHYNSAISTSANRLRSAAAVHFRTYHDTRYGFTVDVPSSWSHQVSPVGDGVTFFHPTGDKMFVNPNPPTSAAVLTVQGVPNATMGSAAGQSFAEMRSEVQGIVKGLQSSPGVRMARYGVSNGFVWMITERSVGRDATEYYKAYFDLSTIQEMQLVYPTDEEARYQGVIERVAKSFVPGRTQG